MTELNALVTEVSAFSSWEALIFSIENHRYVPTIYPDSVAKLKLRAALTDAGYRVYPPEERTDTRTNYTCPDGSSDTCYDCSREVALQAPNWSGKDAIPAVGDRVSIYNEEEYGPGTVVGHRVEHDWAGFWVELDTPCTAERTGNYGKKTVFAFGCDLLDS